MAFGFGGLPGGISLADDVNGDWIADPVIYRNGPWYSDCARSTKRSKRPAKSDSDSVMSYSFTSHQDDSM